MRGERITIYNKARENKWDGEGEGKVWFSWVSDLLLHRTILYSVRTGGFRRSVFFMHFARILTQSDG